MKRMPMTWLIVIAAGLAGMATVAARAETEEESSDRAVYNQLVGEARRAHVSHAQACRQVLAEGRRGEVSMNTKARLLSLRTLSRPLCLRRWPQYGECHAGPVLYRRRYPTRMTGRCRLGTLNS